MLYSSLDTLLKVSKTTSPKKLLAYDCVTLYIYSVSQRKVFDSFLALMWSNINIFSISLILSIEGWNQLSFGSNFIQMQSVL